MDAKAVLEDAARRQVRIEEAIKAARDYYEKAIEEAQSEEARLKLKFRAALVEPWIRFSGTYLIGIDGEMAFRVVADGLVGIAGDLVRSALGDTPEARTLFLKRFNMQMMTFTKARDFGSTQGEQNGQHGEHDEASQA